ncbi:protein mono-ADP-ribosyltransferase PARP14-like [Branchiostoma floridae x Branchiostoma belcheri]
MKVRVMECLQQAEKNGLTSVAFPAIGTGGFGVSATDAARETIQGIKDFALTKNPGKVKLVRVTVFQASMVAEFQQALQAALPKAPIAPAAAVTPVVTPVAKRLPNTNAEQVVEVTFFACNQMNMDNAKREVSQTIDSHMIKERVDDDRLRSTVGLLQQTEKDSIIQMGTDQLVLVTITGHTIELTGLTEDVSGVLREIECFLREKKTAYDAEELKKDVIKVPDHWTAPPSDATGAHIVSLQQTTAEYKDVEKTFLASVGYTPQIVSISRVQNEAKYKAYMLELKQREKRLGKSNIEKVLYHGTAHDVVDNINEGGFNRSYCGKNATHYGRGMYFARDASYSAQSAYSPPDPQGNKHMYQVRVIVGEYTRGNSGIVEPPSKNPSNVAVRYDSVVDNVQNPSIYVVFRDNEAYPEYLIVFK